LFLLEVLLFGLMNLVAYTDFLFQGGKGQPALHLPDYQTPATLDL
jgi:hypothetical protein